MEYNLGKREVFLILYENNFFLDELSRYFGGRCFEEYFAARHGVTQHYVSILEERVWKEDSLHKVN